MLIPKPFQQIRDRFKDKILCDEYTDSSLYSALLAQADITVSTAHQENFGLAAAEAVLAGALPLFPNRLSYPELLPENARESSLYNHENEFPERLLHLVRICRTPEALDKRKLLRKYYHRYCWSHVIDHWDQAVEETVVREKS